MHRFIVPGSRYTIRRDALPWRAIAAEAARQNVQAPHLIRARPVRMLALSVSTRSLKEEFLFRRGMHDLTTQEA